MTPTTLLFDYGGTLDSGARHWNFVLLDGYRQAAEHFPALRAVEGEVWRAAYVHGERTLARQPIITPDDDFRTLLHKKIAVELAFLREGGTVTLSDADCAAATDSIADYCDHAARRHADEARHILQTLRDRGYRFVLVTNFYGNIHAVLRAYGLADFFPHIVESAVVGVRKPDPAIWQLGIDAAAVPAASCVAIGDSFSKDIVPAHSLGAQTIWFKGEEWEQKDYDETLPTHVITALSQLLEHLL